MSNWANRLQDEDSSVPSKLKSQELRFNRLLLEAVDEALASLGEASKQSIYFHLERKFRVKKPEIPEKIDECAQALEKIFGSGAYFIEVLIIKHIHEKTGSVVEWSESVPFAFSKYVAMVKVRFLAEAARNIASSFYVEPEMALESKKAEA